MASYTSVAALKALFPDTPDAALQESLLQARGNVDQAASLLLEKDATGPQNEGIVKQALKSPPGSRLQSRVGRPPQRKGGGWHALSVEEQQKSRSASPVARFVDQHGNETAPPMEDSFPQLSLESKFPHKSSTKPVDPTPAWKRTEQNAHPQGKSNVWGNASTTPQKKVNGEGNRYESDMSHGPKHAGSHDALLADLCHKYPLADVSTLHEAILAAKGKPNVVNMLLSGMLSSHADAMSPPTGEQIGNSVAARENPSHIHRERPSYQFAKPQSRETLPAKARQKGMPSDSDLEKEEAFWPGKSLNGPTVVKKGSNGHSKRASQSPRPRASKDKGATPLPATPTSAASPAAGRVLDLSPDVSEDESAMSVLSDLRDGGATSSDLYHTYRSHALSLDRRRFRRLKQAANFYTSGDHHAARFAVSEAKSIKAEAELAHREAASQIEQESNKDKPVWELDLHGLHLAEANQAVDKRLKLLESQRLAHDDSRTLRVIVGKGSHSSGGEAILQRSVQNHLLGQQYKFEQRGGMLVVHPKRK